MPSAFKLVAIAFNDAPPERIDRIRAVTHDDVARVLGRVFGGERTLAAVGPVDDRDFPV